MHASVTLRLVPFGTLALLRIPGGLFASRYFYNGRKGVIKLLLSFLALKAYCFRTFLKKVRMKASGLSMISLLYLT
jgi:hypothetical protein